MPFLVFAIGPDASSERYVTIVNKCKVDLTTYLPNSRHAGISTGTYKEANKRPFRV